MIEIIVTVIVTLLILVWLSKAVDDHPYAGWGHQPTETVDKSKIVPPPPPSTPRYTEGSEEWLRKKIEEVIAPLPDAQCIKIGDMMMNVTWVRRNGELRAKVKMTKPGTLSYHDKMAQKVAKRQADDKSRLELIP